MLVCPCRSGTRLVLIVLGEADLSTAPELRHQLMAGLAFSPTAITIDVAGLNFCGLAGLDALHDLLTAARLVNVPVTVKGMSPQLAWLHRTFPPAAAVSPERRLRRVDLSDAPVAATLGLDSRQADSSGAMLRVGQAVGEEGR